MKASNQTLTVIFLMGMALFMTACSSSQTDFSSDLSSRSPVESDSNTSTSDSSTSNSASSYVATCNYGVKADVGAKLKMFVDSAGQYRMDLVMVRLTSVPADFASDASYFGFWKWLATSSGSTYMGKGALNFRVIDTYTNTYITDWKTTLLWSDVKSKAQSWNMSTPQAFFNRVAILIDLQNDDTTYAINEYDVLKVVSYTRSTQKANVSLDVLLPPFAANPNTYATESAGTTRASVLQNLHPFASNKNQGYSSSQFLAFSKSYCF